MYVCLVSVLQADEVGGGMYLFSIGVDHQPIYVGT